VDSDEPWQTAGGSDRRSHSSRSGQPRPPIILRDDGTAVSDDEGPADQEDLDDDELVAGDTHGAAGELANPSAREGNRGSKLKVGSRWVRKGKAVSWGMGYGEREVRL